MNASRAAATARATWAIAASRCSGDCSAVDWTFLGGTIANWSFVWFVIFGVVILAVLLTLPRRGGVMPA